MAAERIYVVWEWLDDDGLPCYVGVGKQTGKHPADILFSKRHESDSTLTRWLRTLKKRPKRSPDVPAFAMHKADAKGVAFARKKELQEMGFVLLTTRPFDTIAGGGVARGVLAPDGEIYESVREAAKAHGVNQCTITRRCTKQTGGWSYIETEDSE